jgi:hypothetical protein
MYMGADWLNSQVFLNTLGKSFVFQLSGTT